MAANIHTQWKYGHPVFYDTYRHRWLFAFGNTVDVVQFHLNTALMARDDTTTDLSGFTHTAVEAGAGDSTAVLSNNTLLITTAANENDGVNLQVIAEAFDLASTNLVYFGICFQINDADQTDFLTGLCITDTTLLGGMTDGIYFESLDGSTDINFVLEKNSTETTSASAIGTLADDTDVTLEFLFDGTNVDSWVNGTLQTRLATTNLPNDEQLTPSIHFLTGEATANTMTVKWWRAIQINA
jgi:hypothetical protein